MSTLAIIQARYASTRFPGKVLADLHGKPMIEHVVDRARRIRGVDHVFVARPWSLFSIGEGMLRDECERIGVDSESWNDDPSDVLERFWRVAGWIDEADIIVRLTSDCPLLQPDICSRLLTNWRASSCEYGWLDTHSGIWPDGLDCECFTRELLMRAHEQATEPADREHVTSWMRRNATVYSLPADPAYAGWPKLSVDDESDLQRVREWHGRT